jgi:putative tricarboxylic transport membrane protein
MPRLARTFGLSLAATLALTGAALAEYPEKPVEFIVPWPPGDLEDVLTRMIANEFQETYGVPAAVVNKPGGGGGPFPGAVEVANAPADGYVIGSFVIDVPIGGPNLGIPELSPNPFEPIGIFLTYPFVVAAGADAPFSDWAGLAEYAKSNDVSLGHFGDFLPPTKVTFAAAKESGFEFASNAAFDALDCNTLASGDADVINTTLQQILPCKDDVRILASIGGERIAITPDTPTIEELFPDLSLALWNGLFVKTGTPQDARDKIAAVAQKVMSSEAAAKLAADTGALIYWQDAAAAADQIAKDTDAIARVNAMVGQ